MQPDPSPLSAGDLDGVRRSCFDTDPRTCFVSRTIAHAVSRTVRGKEVFPDDVFQDAYCRVLSRFDALFHAFLAVTNGDKRRDGFERYLRRAIHNLVHDSLRGERRRATALLDDVEVPSSTRPDAADRLPLQALMDQALAELEPLERRILSRRLVDRDDPDDIARDESIKKAQFSRLVHLAKVRVKMSLIRLAVQRAERRLDSLDRRLIAVRCRKKYPCYMYQVECAHARPPNELLEQLSLGRSEGAADAVKAVVDGLKNLEAHVFDILDDWGIHTTLKSCLWDR